VDAERLVTRLVTPVAELGAKRWVTQCALSRICGACGESLAWPVAFVGSPEEVARNAFHLPPMHVACAEDLRRTPEADPSWQVTLTSGFEFVRAGREDPDARPTFQPNSLLGDDAAGR
jgi:hypothetical protein